MTTQPRPVVIGVDGTDANAGALRYGVEEARRTGALVKLIHVVPDYVPISPMMPLTPSELTETGTAVLMHAEAQVRELAPDLVVEGWLHHGTRPVQLANAADDAQVVVVGRDNRPLLERLLRGDTAAGVAARASVPMVLVPADWTPGPGPGRGVVLVGVKSPSHSTALLGDAMALAADRGAKLVVVHAWKLPSGYDDIIESRVAADDWRRQSIEEMEALLKDWRVSFPGVEVEVRVVHDHPSFALVEGSAEADVVVLVRRAHGVPAATHLGGTARAVLRSAHCPVRVVPPDAVGPVPGLVLEQAGAIRK